jgi:hypothetical protein
MAVTSTAMTTREGLSAGAESLAMCRNAYWIGARDHDHQWLRRHHCAADRADHDKRVAALRIAESAEDG